MILTRIHTVFLQADNPVNLESSGITNYDAQRQHKLTNSVITHSNAYEDACDDH